MLCIECGAVTEKGYTTDVTDLGNCLVIIRNVPCYKCTECNEIIYTGDVVQEIEKLLIRPNNVFRKYLSLIIIITNKLHKYDSDTVMVSLFLFVI